MGGADDVRVGVSVVKTELRIIYGDTDQMGVVYYANYLRYFEAGRNEFLRARGLRYRDFERDHRVYLPVVEVQVSYKRPARYDDLITVETSLARLGPASVRFEYRIVRQQGEQIEVLVTGSTHHGCVDGEGVVRPLPREVAERLRSGPNCPPDT